MTTTLVEETRKETKRTTGNSVSDAVSQRTTMCQVPADGIRSPGLVTYNVVTQLRQACSICYSCSIALCHITAWAAPKDASQKHEHEQNTYLCGDSDGLIQGLQHLAPAGGGG